MFKIEILASIKLQKSPQLLVISLIMKDEFFKVHFMAYTNNYLINQEANLLFKLTRYLC